MKQSIERFYTDSAFKQSLKSFSNAIVNGDFSRIIFWRDRVNFFVGELNRLDRDFFECKIKKAA